ncbi:hypothetical protein E8P82_06905 [Arthrobacter echini]|uniref:DUF5709 domain-containing protein n=1 Tax=Arthrobacter echini TaxID=1529066 RepID=A0A4S5E594_9MICC|nr:hypothetical protein [Arthrobacter echini]THJ66674.1 hypothetical protein E8P82_06905 [Arthrobacter echini]
MTENLPDEELTVEGEEPGVPVDPLEPESLDPVVDGRPDSYEGAAEDNPDRWQEDPLLQDDPEANDLAADDLETDDTGTDDVETEDSVDEENGITDGEEGELTEQLLRADTAEARYEDGEEQIPPEEPRIGEAAADVDFGMMEDDEGYDGNGSDDPANRGGSSLSAMDDPEPR